MENEWKAKIFDVSRAGFEPLALEIFRFQAVENPVYRDYLQALGINISNINRVESIPFLPIRFFKSHKVQTTDFQTTLFFESSGTSNSLNSRHYIKDNSIYEASFQKGFEAVYGSIKGKCILGLLPSYLERAHSSLIYMVDWLIKASGHPKSGFYLQDYDEAAKLLHELDSRGDETILIGVSYALLEMAEKFPLRLKNTIVMETGGMKGRREEMTRMELHEQLKRGFGVPTIHSEYGMTELLSQAYSTGSGIFRAPEWMKILIREEDDPFTINSQGSGAINIIDLANIYSCCFIATDDAGKLNEDGSFEVLGRLDGSDMRGCSLMV
jgi:hypothetical protein